MKRIKRTITLFCTFGLAFILHLTAHSFEGTYTPQYWLIFDGYAQPQQTQAYLEAHQQLNAVLLQTEVEGFRRWGARNHSDSGHFIFGHRLKSFHEIGELHQKWSELLQDEAAAEVYGSVQEASLYYDASVWLERPDLDYIPENPRLNPNTALWTHQIYFYLIPGKTDEFLNLWREYRELLKENNVPDYAWVFSQVLGNENPVILLNVTTNGPDDYVEALNKSYELLGEQGEQLRMRMLETTRKIEETDVELLPRLTTIGAPE